MLSRINRVFDRIRAAGRDDAGASLMLVIGLMVVGFIVASVIASACLFAIRQTSQGRTNVQAFAAAEAGRDAVVAQLAADPEDCDGADFEDVEFAPGLTYDAVVYAVEDAAMPEGVTGTMTASCPTDDTRWVVIASEGIVDTGTARIEAVYEWVKYREKVSGGGLGYMDQSYAAAGVSYSGDIVVRHGDFTCNWGSTINGSVYVLNGNANVPADLSASGSCRITGDLVVNGNISVQRWCLVELFSLGCVYASLEVGRQVKAAGSISVGGTLTADANGRTSDPDPASPAPAYKRDIAAGGSISANKSGSSIRTVHDGGIFAAGAIDAASGPITAAGAISSGSISAANAVTAGWGITVFGAIAGSATVRANGGDMVSGSSITGNGQRIATGAITAVVDISGTGTKSASTVRAGNDITGGAITTSANLQAGRDLTGSAARTAGGSILVGRDLTTTGALQSGATIAVGRNFSTTADLKATGSVTAVGTLSATNTCTIQGDVIAGGTLNFTQRGTSAPQCRITGKLWSNSASVSTLPAHGTGSSATQLWVGGAVQSRGGWSAAGRYKTIPAGTVTDPTPDKSTVPTAPAAPTIVNPTAAPAYVFAISNPGVDTFYSIDELYLRTGWIDLGKYTTWTGYTVLPPLSGTSQCRNSYIRTLIQAGGDPIVIDATGCAGTVDLSSWTSLNVSRDVVLLVNKVNVSFTPFTQTGGTAEHPRQLFIVQVDTDATLRVPPSGGEAVSLPDCAAPTDSTYRLNLSMAGWGPFDRWADNLRVLLYSPCGIRNSTTFAYNWQGHIYVANDSATTDVLASVICKRMTVEQTLDLPCSVNDYGEWGGFHNEDAARLGARAYQTEP